MKVKIPAGVADGQKIRLKGKGQPSPDGGEAGDLVITVTVRKHPVFERDGRNLRVDVPVTFAEAALGATIEVPTLGGDAGEAARRARHPERPRAAGQGPRRRHAEGHRRPARDRPGGRAVAPERQAKEALEAFAAADARPRTRATTCSSGPGADVRRWPTAMDETARCSRSRPPPSSRACIRRPCASTTGSAWSSRGARPGSRAATRCATSSSCARSPGSAREGLNLEGIRRILELENQVTRARSRGCASWSGARRRAAQPARRRVFAAGESGVVPLRRACAPAADGRGRLAPGR